MRLPWWHTTPEPDNPNGFYPEQLDVRFCQCSGCHTDIWTFDIQDATAFVFDHQMCGGYVELEPAMWAYRQLRNSIWRDAQHTIGQRK